MCQVNGSLLVAPPFPPSGPGKPGSPPSSVLRGCYDFPLARTCSLMVSVTGPTRPSSVRGRRSAPDELGGSPSGLEHLISRRSLPGMSHPWARAGSRRFPGDPSHASALLQDPGRVDRTSPLAVLPTPPPAYPNRRPQRAQNIEAAVYASRETSPPPMQNSLPAGGLRLFREGVEPSGSLRKVSGYIPFSFPGLILSQGSFSPSRRLPVPMLCWPISAATPTGSPSPTRV